MIKEILVFFVGIFVGVMNSIAGGGMLVGFPVLILAGLSPLSANITGNLVVLPGGISSAFGYRKYIKTLKKIYLILLVPCLVGGILGASVLKKTSSSGFEKIAPLLVIFGVGLFMLQPIIHRHLHHHIKRERKDILPIVLISIALFPVAIYGGYFGAGFGFIMLAFLGFSNITEIHKMNGLKNLASVTISVASLIVLATSPKLNYKYGVIMAIGSFFGGYFGSVLIQKIPAKTVRLLIVIIGLSTATYLSIKAYKL